MNKLYALFTVLFAFSAYNSLAQCSDVFFSEYVEGTSNNKSLEIYNPTNAAIVLTGNYELRRYTNGNPVPASIALTGTINPQDVFVITNTSSAATLIAVSDQLNANINHNGNDAYELYHIPTASVVDVIGVPGTDPGSGWTVSGIANATLNHTLRRKPSVQSGNTVWLGGAENEWTVYNLDTYNYIGFHIMNSCLSTLTAAGNVTDFCLNDLFSFSSTSSNGTAPINYAWEFGDGTNTIVNTQNGTYNYSSPGTYNITLLVTDVNNQVYAEVYTINVYPAGPTACVSTSPMDGCGTDTLSITNCSTGGTGSLSYYYFFDNGNTSSLETPPIQYYSVGNYNAYLVVTDVNGCDDTTAGTFTVSAADDPSFSYAQSVYCASESNPLPNISGTPGGVFTCNGCIINAASGEIDLSASADGNYTVQYQTSGTCSESSTVNITITSSIADATIFPAGPFCESGTTVTLTAASPGGIWSGAGISNANAGTFDPAMAGPGSHQIDYVIPGACGSSSSIQIVVDAFNSSTIASTATVICNNEPGANLLANPGGTWSGAYVSDSGAGLGFFTSASTPAGPYYAVYTMNDACADKDSVLITVSEAPVADFTYSVVGLSIQFTDASTGAVVYAWEITEGSSIVNNTTANPVYNYNDPSNTLDVCLTVISADGCTSEYCEQILPNGLNENLLAELALYPNPICNGEFNISGLNNLKKGVVRISNVMGQEIYSAGIPEGSDRVLIRLEDQPAGTYFVRISGDNYLITKKLFKNN